MGLRTAGARWGIWSQDTLSGQENWPFFADSKLLEYAGRETGTQAGRDICYYPAWFPEPQPLWKERMGDWEITHSWNQREQVTRKTDVGWTGAGKGVFDSGAGEKGFRSLESLCHYHVMS